MKTWKTFIFFRFLCSSYCQCLSMFFTFLTAQGQFFTSKYEQNLAKRTSRLQNIGAKIRQKIKLVGDRVSRPKQATVPNTAEDNMVVETSRSDVLLEECEVGQ